MTNQLLSIAAVFTGSTAVLLAQSNIDNTIPNKYGWGENTGWTNWRGEAAPGQGAVVGAFVMTGFAWGENVGWINLSVVTAGNS